MVTLLVTFSYENQHTAEALDLVRRLMSMPAHPTYLLIALALSHRGSKEPEVVDLALRVVTLSSRRTLVPGTGRDYLTLAYMFTKARCARVSNSLRVRAER